MLNQRLIGFLGWNGEDLSDLLEQGRDAVFHKAHKRFDRGQAGIACRGAVTAFGLEGGEEVHHQRGIDVLQSKTRRRDAKAPTGELKQQLKAVGIALTGMGAGPSLVGQTVAQKCADMRCDCCHTRSPYTNASQHWVISTISSGVLSKYQ